MLNRIILKPSFIVAYISRLDIMPCTYLFLWSVLENVFCSYSSYRVLYQCTILVNK